jgi:hypothetical protein
MALARIGCLITVLFLSGCASFKEDVGNYVADAVKESVSKQLDEKLAAKNLSIAEVKSDLVLSDPRGTVGLIKDLTEAFVIVEAHKVVDQKVADAKLVSQDQLEGHATRFSHYIMATAGSFILGLLGKLLHSAKNNAVFDHRLKVVEKLLGHEA